MKTITFNSEFFNIKDTLECGQVFRFVKKGEGYLCFTLDKCCYAYTEGEKTHILCEDSDGQYFYNYFDLARNYEKIYTDAQSYNVEALSISAFLGRGVRILSQNPTETLFSFIVSQNNNIPRIKNIIEKLCRGLGEEKSFNGEKYYAFPTVEKMALASLEFYKSIGLGYRAEYIKRLAEDIYGGFDVDVLSDLSTKELKKELLKIYGVGPKVADCVALFGFRKSDSFPVDTWIEKVYRENFNGTLTSRDKMSDYFTEKFALNAGYFQQYLFYYKRSLEQK